MGREETTGSPFPLQELWESLVRFPGDQVPLPLDCDHRAPQEFLTSCCLALLLLLLSRFSRVRLCATP